MDPQYMASIILSLFLAMLMQRHFLTSRRHCELLKSNGNVTRNPGVMHRSTGIGCRQFRRLLPHMVSACPFSTKILECNTDDKAMSRVAIPGLGSMLHSYFFISGFSYERQRKHLGTFLQPENYDAFRPILKAHVRAMTDQWDRDLQDTRDKGLGSVAERNLNADLYRLVMSIAGSMLFRHDMRAFHGDEMSAEDAAFLRNYASMAVAAAKEKLPLEMDCWNVYWHVIGMTTTEMLRVRQPRNLAYAGMMRKAARRYIRALREGHGNHTSNLGFTSLFEMLMRDEGIREVEVEESLQSFLIISTENLGYVARNVLQAIMIMHARDVHLPENFRIMRNDPTYSPEDLAHYLIRETIRSNPPMPYLLYQAKMHMVDPEKNATVKNATLNPGDRFIVDLLGSCGLEAKPFGAGCRKCPAADFSIKILVWIMEEILYRYKLETCYHPLSCHPDTPEFDFLPFISGPATYLDRVSISRL